MAHIPRLELAARHHTANTPGFIPSQYVATVQLNGGLTAFIINMGHDIRTQRGEEAANFMHALYTFCLERCALGLGDAQYDPFPFNGVPPQHAPNLGGMAGGQQGAPAQDAPPAQGHDIGADPPNAQGNKGGVDPPQHQNFDGIPEDLAFLFDDNLPVPEDIDLGDDDIIILD
jgi:hypothetical protein